MSIKSLLSDNRWRSCASDSMDTQWPFNCLDSMLGGIGGVVLP